MRWASFRRAACFGGNRRRRWWIYLLGFSSALLTVLLVADVGLILDLVHSLRGDELALDNWRFAAWLGLPNASWGWLDRYENCLLGLLAALLILATAESLLLLLLYRAGELAAWDAVAQLQIAVYGQVRRLGVPDWFEREGRQAEQRVLADCLSVREGLAACWTTVPRSACASVLLLALAAYVDFFLSLLAILLVLFVWRLYQRLQTRSDVANRNAQAQLTARQQAVLDAFRTARIVEGVTAAATDDESFVAAFDRYRRDTRHGLTARVALGPWLLWLLGMGAALLLLVVGLSPRPTPTGLGVLALALARLALPVIRMRRTIQTVHQADEAAEEVFAYLDRTPGVGQIAGALALPWPRSRNPLGRRLHCRPCRPAAVGGLVAVDSRRISDGTGGLRLPCSLDDGRTVSAPQRSRRRTDSRRRHRLAFGDAPVAPRADRLCGGRRDAVFRYDCRQHPLWPDGPHARPDRRRGAPLRGVRGHQGPARGVRDGGRAGRDQRAGFHGVSHRSGPRHDRQSLRADRAGAAGTGGGKGGSSDRCRAAASSHRPDAGRDPLAVWRCSARRTASF